MSESHKSSDPGAALSPTRLLTAGVGVALFLAVSAGIGLAVKASVPIGVGLVVIVTIAAVVAQQRLNLHLQPYFVITWALYCFLPFAGRGRGATYAGRIQLDVWYLLGFLFIAFLVMHEYITPIPPKDGEKSQH